MAKSLAQTVSFKSVMNKKQTTSNYFDLPQHTKSEPNRMVIEEVLTIFAPRKHFWIQPSFTARGFKALGKMHPLQLNFYKIGTRVNLAKFNTLIVHGTANKQSLYSWWKDSNAVMIIM